MVWGSTPKTPATLTVIVGMLGWVVGELRGSQSLLWQHSRGPFPDERVPSKIPSHATPARAPGFAYL